MKNLKKKAAVLIVSILLFSSITLSPHTTVQAATVKPNKYTYVRDAPYWTNSVVDQFGTTQSVTILERDYEYLYIEYTKDGVKKRGYMPLADISNPSYSWCNHTEFNPGYNNTGSSVAAYYGPSSSYGVSGSIDNNEGEVNNKPLLVLRNSGSYAFIQYVTNPNAGQNTNPQYKRAWVLKSKITVQRPSAPSYLNGSYYALIKNQSNGKYLTYENGNILYENASGDFSQQWYIEKINDSSGAIYYKIHPYNKNTNTWQVNSSWAILGDKITIQEDSSPDPNKAQEFQIVEDGDYFSIFTRASGCYLAVEYADNTTVQVRKNNGAAQNWSIERLNKYFENGYANATKIGNIFKLGYFIFTNDNSDYGIEWAGITTNQVKTAIERWNTVPSGLVRIEEKELLADADIKIYAYDLGNTALVQTFPSLNGTSFPMDTPLSYWDQEWGASFIILNSTTNTNYENYFAGRSMSDQIGVICHELGHALKLKHPYGEDIDTRATVDSVMTPGLASTNAHISDTPTEYDYTTFKIKWSRM